MKCIANIAPRTGMVELATAATYSAYAQHYPAKQIRYIVAKPNTEVRRILALEEIKARISGMGVGGLTPARR